MSNLGISKREFGSITQNYHMLSKGLRMKRPKEIKNLEPVILSSSAKPKNMQKAFRLATERTSRVRTPHILERWTQRQALE